MLYGVGVASQSHKHQSPEQPGSTFTASDMSFDERPVTAPPLLRLHDDRLLGLPKNEACSAASHLPGLHMATKSRGDGAKGGSGGEERLDEEGMELIGG